MTKLNFKFFGTSDYTVNGIFKSNFEVLKHDLLNERVELLNEIFAKIINFPFS